MDKNHKVDSYMKKHKSNMDFLSQFAEKSDTGDKNKDKKKDSELHRLVEFLATERIYYLFREVGNFDISKLKTVNVKQAVEVAQKIYKIAKEKDAYADKILIASVIGNINVTAGVNIPYEYGVQTGFLAEESDTACFIGYIYRTHKRVGIADYAEMPFDEYRDKMYEVKRTAKTEGEARLAEYCIRNGKKSLKAAGGTETDIIGVRVAYPEEIGENPVFL